MLSFPPAKEHCPRWLVRLNQGYRRGSAGRAFAQRNANIGVGILRFRIATKELLKDLIQARKTSEHSNSSAGSFRAISLFWTEIAAEHV